MRKKIAGVVKLLRNMGGLRPRPYCSSIFQSSFDALSAHSLDKFEVFTEGASMTVMQGRRSSQNPPAVILIERCALIRDCLGRCIGDDLGYGIVSFPDIDSWQKASPEHQPSLIVFCARENDFDGLRGYRGAATAAGHFDRVRRSSVARSSKLEGEVRLDEGKTGHLGSLALVEPAPTHGSEAPNWFPLAGSKKPEQIVVKTRGYLGNVGSCQRRRFPLFNIKRDIPQTKCLPLLCELPNQGCHNNRRNVPMAKPTSEPISYRKPDGLILSTGNLYFTYHDAATASVWRAAQTAIPGQEILLYSEPGCRFGDIVFAQVDGIWWGYFFSTGAGGTATIKRVPLTGGAATVLTTVTDVDVANSHRNLITDGENLYWQDVEFSAEDAHSWWCRRNSRPSKSKYTDSRSRLAEWQCYLRLGC